ncbi:MAG: ACP phosphodiesterase [Pseudomonadota bacterium]|nr:ACP phosphodiesterase [Pseudomonadota bacterium]MEC8485090.1 ACP phosphodiesterase [Pseudomonadota bacterium]
MNYIAHLHIAKVTDTSYAGNLLGDFPWLPNNEQQDLVTGWRLHQAVDTFVDAHPQSLAFKSLPREGRRRFAGIVQDVVMDYWLVRSWRHFEQVSFERFADTAVSALREDKENCPQRLQAMISSLEQRNWLSDLGTQQGVERALRSIQRRWTLGHYLEPFIQELPLLLEQSRKPFEILYPDVLDYVQAMDFSEGVDHIKERPQ